MSDKDGGQAFPVSLFPGPMGDLHAGQPGMALRDYFAAQMAPAAATLFPFKGARDSWNGGSISVLSQSGRDQIARWRADVATEAYHLADAMLAERSK